MSDKKKLEKIAEIKDHLVRARKLADAVDLPKIVYRGVDPDKLKLDVRLLDILKYIGNGCPNIYYADRWGVHILPECQVAIASQLDALIRAMEMAGIQEEIGTVAPEVASKLQK